MPITEVFAGIAVSRRDDATEFHQRVFGISPFMLPNDDEAAWQLAALGGREVEHSPVGGVEGAVRSVWIGDPAGNRRQIAQPG